jgi:hypothetical protein
MSDSEHYRLEDAQAKLAAHLSTGGSLAGINIAASRYQEDRRKEQALERAHLMLRTIQVAGTVEDVEEVALSLQVAAARVLIRPTPVR